MAARNRAQRESQAILADYQAQANAYNQAVVAYSAAQAKLTTTQQQITDNSKANTADRALPGIGLRYSGSPIGGRSRLVGFQR